MNVNEAVICVLVITCGYKGKKKQQVYYYKQYIIAIWFSRFLHI